MAEPAGRSQAFVHMSIPQAYEAYLVGPLFAPWAQNLVDAVGIQAGAVVLDVASGTGVVAQLAAARVGASGQVTGTDISPAMLAVAAAKPVRAAEVRWIECAADALAVADASQDVVLCQHGLQFFPRQGAALREMRRVLRPGGTIGLVVWAAEQPFGLYGPMIDAVARVCPDPYPRAFDQRSYTMQAAEVVALLHAAGFSDIATEQQTVTATWATLDLALAAIQGTTFGPLLAALPAGQQDEVRRELSVTLGTRTPTGGVSCPTFAHVVRGVA